MEMNAQPADWPDQHKTYWLGLASTVGATEQHARMAYALSTGMSQTAGARFAGYRGDARTAGYAAARTRAVSVLLAMAEGDGWQSPNNFVSEEEKDKLLSSLMRSGDPQVRLRAIEQADKRREREAERERGEAERAAAECNPLKTLNEIAGLSPILAVMLAQHHGLAWQAPAITVANALGQIEEMKTLVSSFANAAATPAVEAQD